MEFDLSEPENDDFQDFHNDTTKNGGHLQSLEKYAEAYRDVAPPYLERALEKEKQEKEQRAKAIKDLYEPEWCGLFLNLTHSTESLCAKAIGEWTNQQKNQVRDANADGNNLSHSLLANDALSQRNTDSNAFLKFQKGLKKALGHKSLSMDTERSRRTKWETRDREHRDNVAAYEALKKFSFASTLAIMGEFLRECKTVAYHNPQYFVFVFTCSLFAPYALYKIGEAENMLVRQLFEPS